MGPILLVPSGIAKGRSEGSRLRIHLSALNSPRTDRRKEIEDVQGHDPRFWSKVLQVMASILELRVSSGPNWLPTVTSSGELNGHCRVQGHCSQLTLS